MVTTVIFEKTGGPEVLTLQNKDLPPPAAGEVRLKMDALAVNRANALWREGTYLFPTTLPARIGTEGVGTIVAVGPGVTGWEIGRKANLLPPDHEGQSGYFAAENNVPVAKLLPAPSGIDDRIAATVWVPFLTLYEVFVQRGLAGPGDWVILPAAASSVALAAQALARHLGAQTIGITRSEAKRATLEKAGYDAVVVAENGDVAAQIGAICKGGAQLLFDPVGGAQLADLAPVMAPGSSIIIYGVLSGAPTEVPVFEMMAKRITLQCYTVYGLISDPPKLQAAIAFFLPLFEAGTLAPVVDPERFSLSQIADAFRFMESNDQIGKVVVSL